jgi:hypothetical protein
MSYADAISDADFFDEAPEGDDDEPRCSDCGCCLFTEEHAYDCSIGDEAAEDEV